MNKRFKVLPCKIEIKEKILQVLNSLYCRHEILVLRASIIIEADFISYHDVPLIINVQSNDFQNCLPQAW